MSGDLWTRRGRRHRSRWTWLGAAGFLVGLAAGCGDVALNVGGQEQHQPRPVGRPAGRLVAESTDTSRNTEGWSAPASPAQEAGVAAEPSQASAEPTSSPLNVFQLVLLSEAGPAEAPPGFKHVRLQQARARDVANVLAVLYLPSGPSGTDHRYTLVYPTSLEHRLAGEAARQLDVGTFAEKPANSTPGDLWRWGVAEAFAVLEDVSIPADRVRQAAVALEGTISSPSLSNLQRWSAAMLAGELFAGRLYDFAAANAAYRQAFSTVQAGSYEQMALAYAQARAFQQDGRREEARRAFESILGQFSTMRGCEVFERTRNILAQWERRR